MAIEGGGGVTPKELRDAIGMVTAAGQSAAVARSMLRLCGMGLEGMGLEEMGSEGMGFQMSCHDRAERCSIRELEQARPYGLMLSIPRCLFRLCLQSGK